MRRVFFYGVGIWVAATLVLRFAGQYILRPGDTGGTLVLFAISFPAMAFLARRLCEGPAGGAALALPTLLLDAFSSAFFPVVFPNMAPQVAGVFGGWMLWCCAGALIGATRSISR